MKMAKATQSDIDAAGEAMSVLNDISSGYYPARGDDQTDGRFNPDDFEHLRKFHDLMNATLDASPGWPGRVIGGMCYVIMFDENKIVDPSADTLELHPRFAAAPELLEQLKLVLPLLEGINKRCTQDTAMIASVRAAITKAQGGAA